MTQTPVLVTGGTGTLGQLLVPRLQRAGTRVRILSRQPHHAANGVEYITGDLASGEGVDAAVQGVRTIVHAAGAMKGDDDKARNLVQASVRAGGQAHVVFISVVGTDRIPAGSRPGHGMFGYFAAKRAAEQVIADSGLAWTTLRATQFHDLILRVAHMMRRLPVLPAPSGFRFQPIDAAEVADRLADLAVGTPAGLVADMGGPRTYALSDLLRSYVKATNRHRPILPIALAGNAAAAFRAGVNLAPDHAVGQRTWEDFLAERITD